MKKCSKCGEEKPESGYYKRKKRDGSYCPMTECRECIKARNLAYYRKNHEARKAKKREYVRANKDREKARTAEWLARPGNAERKKAGDRAWVRANRERKAAADRAWGKANRERARKNHKRYRERHPERVKTSSLFHGLGKRGAPAKRVVKGWLTIIRADPCAYCGASMQEIDHISPVGTMRPDEWNGWSNLTASCRSCNRHKAAKPLLTFLRDR